MKRCNYFLFLVLAIGLEKAAAQCGPKNKPYPAGTTECGNPGGGEGGAPAGGPAGDPAGGSSGDPASTSSHAASMLGNIGSTTVGGTPAGGSYLAAGEDIYGPFEAGFGSQQDFILEGLGCSSGSLGHVQGGIDTWNAEQMVAKACGVTLPRFEGDKYVSLLDQCGGHTKDYHFHEKFSCLFSNNGGHSAQVGRMQDGKFIYGKWEDDSKQELPKLDACGGHWGRTPESPNVDVYHYHVQDAPPFTVGCYGPNDDNSLVTVSQCRSFYGGCDGVLSTIDIPSGTKQYDEWCPCFDATGSNSGLNIVELAVFAGSSPTPATPAPATPAPATPAPAGSTPAPASSTPAPGPTPAAGPVSGGTPSPTSPTPASPTPAPPTPSSPTPAAEGAGGRVASATTSVGSSFGQALVAAMTCVLVQ